MLIVLMMTAFWQGLIKLIVIKYAFLTENKIFAQHDGKKYQLRFLLPSKGKLIIVKYTKNQHQISQYDIKRKNMHGMQNKWNINENIKKHQCHPQKTGGWKAWTVKVVVLFHAVSAVSQWGVMRSGEFNVSKMFYCLLSSMGISSCDYDIF